MSNNGRPLSLLYIMCGLIWGLCIVAAIFGVWRLCTIKKYTDRLEKATQCAAAEGDVCYMEMEKMELTNPGGVWGVPLPAAPSPGAAAPAHVLQ